MSRLLLLFIPIVFLAGFFIALIAEQRRDIARWLTAGTIVFIFLAMILFLMPEIKTWIWLNNGVLLVAWVACFATAIKYFRNQSQQRGSAFLLSCLLIAMVTTFTLGNEHVQVQLKEVFCSYVDCSNAQAELVGTDFFFVDSHLDSVGGLSEGEKYNLVLVDSFYKAHSEVVKLIPGLGGMKNDSVKALTLFVWKQEKKVKKLNACISGADEALEEYGDYRGLNMPRYDSLEELRNEMNAAIKDGFNGADLGANGLKFQFVLPDSSGLSGEYDMQLEFTFHSGRRISKRKKITFMQ